MNRGIVGVIVMALSVGAFSAADAQVILRSPERPRQPTPPPPPTHPLPPARVPNIGRLPLMQSMERLGTECIAWGDDASMRRIGIARGWHIFGPLYRRSFVGVDANGRLRYVTDAMQDLGGPYPDREEITVHFFANGRVEVGRRGAWNIGHDAALSLPQVTGLFGSDSVRAYSFARSLLQLCSGVQRR